MKRRISGYPPRWLSTVLALTVLVVVSFAVGRLSAAPLRQSEMLRTSANPPLAPVQDRESPGDARELIPLPGQGEGQSPGEGQNPTPAECPLYLYQDGELFSLQPGPGEGQGPLPGSGRGGPQELIPLEPTPPRVQPTPPTPQPEDEPKDII